MFDPSKTPFIHGLELCQGFHDEVVRPLIQERFPTLRYGAGRLDSGSDVLGFDTPTSRDHAWGPQMTIFLEESEIANIKPELDEYFRQTLPVQFKGYPTNFALHEDGTFGMAAVEGPPVRHLIEITTVRDFFVDYLAYDPEQELTFAHWLSFPEQRLGTIRSGRVFHDDMAALASARASLDYYPHDLWLYLMAVAWRRIDQEEAFMGRTGDVEDEVGSRIISARLIYNIIRLCCLMERQYAPYSKWLGTAFSKLECADSIAPLFNKVLDSQNWKQREESFSAIYLQLGRMHNALGVTESLTVEVSSFHGRPYLVPHSDRFVSALADAITDPAVKDLPEHLGSIDQFVDSTDVLSYPERFQRFRDLISQI